MGNGRNPSKEDLTIACPFFGSNGQIPIKHTGFGADISPQFTVIGLRGDVKTLAIVIAKQGGNQMKLCIDAAPCKA